MANMPNLDDQPPPGVGGDDPAFDAADPRREPVPPEGRAAFEATMAEVGSDKEAAKDFYRRLAGN
jgi:hypothetical protein